MPEEIFRNSKTYPLFESVTIGAERRGSEYYIVIRDENGVEVNKKKVSKEMFLLYGGV